MSRLVRWREVWEKQSKENLSNFELDRGRRLVDEESENLSERLLLAFIEPEESEILLDAGCGTGVNILRLHSRVQTIIGIDYAQGSLERCRKTIQVERIKNAHVCVASVTAIPLPDSSVDKIICLSVLQYLNDEEVRQAFREFARVLTANGIIILHVKNLSSLYWSTLWIAKRIKTLLGGSTRIEHFRSFNWYFNEFRKVGGIMLDYDSFNLLMLDVMPLRLVTFIRRFELRHHCSRLLRRRFMRRHGAELMIKARVGAA